MNRFALLAAAGLLAAAALLSAQEPALASASVYRLRIAISDDLQEVAGSLEVLYTNRGRGPLGSLRFFLYPNLTPGRIRITEARVGGRRVRAESLERRSILEVPLPAPLGSSEKVTIGLDFTVNVPEGSDGAYGLLARGDGYLSLAFAYPMIPSRAAWDHPPPVPYGDFLANDASRYIAQVSVPAGYDLAAPGTVTRRQTASGRTEFTVTLEPARELYMAVGRDWVRTTREQNGVTVTSYAAANAEDSSRRALLTALACLDCFGRRFGPYPYETLTLVSLPIDAYGCEFSGIVVESARLYDPSFVDRGVESRILLESTTAHEIAHQWFYGIVGSDQLLEPWLDEGLAQYAAWLYYRDRHGEEAGQGYFESFEQRWERVGRAEIPISLPVFGYSAKEYGAIIYGRAPLFLKAMSDRMRAEPFDRLMREYCSRFRWEMVETGDLLALAARMCGCNLDDLTSAWGARPPR